MSNAEMASGVAAEQVSPGEQLVQLYQDLWAINARLEQTHELSHSAGLRRVINERHLTAEASQALSEQNLARIGKLSLDGWFAAEARAKEHRQIHNERQCAWETLSRFAQARKGKRVAVEALRVGDKPIFPIGGYALYQAQDRSFPSKDRSRVPAGNGLLCAPAERDSVHLTRYPNQLVLQRTGFRFAKFYIVEMYDEETGEPRVSLNFEK